VTWSTWSATGRALAVLQARFGFDDAACERAAMQLTAVTAYCSPISAGVALAPDDQQRMGRAHLYGQTPPWVLFELLADAGAAKTDVFVDIGSGIGDVVLAARLVCGQAIGVEVVGSRVRTAQAMTRALAVTRATYLHQDAATADLSAGTLLYTYWSALEPKDRRPIAEAMAKAPPGARAVTVTHPLEHDAFELLQTRELDWGLPSRVAFARTLFFHRRR
jgi:hypothetical protein